MKISTQYSLIALFFLFTANLWKHIGVDIGDVLAISAIFHVGGNLMRRLEPEERGNQCGRGETSELRPMSHRPAKGNDP